MRPIYVTEIKYVPHHDSFLVANKYILRAFVYFQRALILIYTGILQNVDTGACRKLTYAGRHRRH